MGQGESENRVGEGCKNKAGTNSQRCAQQGPEQAEAVTQAAHQYAAQAEADHHQGVGQGGIGAADLELGLHHRQHHRNHPHAGVANRHDQQGHQQPEPGVRGVHPGARGTRRLGRAVHRLSCTRPQAATFRYRGTRTA